jgi:hypothetical protein
MGAKLKEYTNREAREEQERSKAQEAERKVQVSTISFGSIFLFLCQFFIQIL